ncbi:ABC transporter-like protein [Gluconacetobacter liquefaciens NRIC 0522]|nr:monosaccharide ABC transporter ATP-binding protein (CUT2 family) [Gluconacetobacter liquefaciens]GBQ95842.1 ABC transporter-like protein [Gluconacetobacter liquefaciens NRIC 0522]
MPEVGHQSSSTESLLSLRGISKQFDGIKVLSDVSLDVRAGEIHALIGANGAGKSTVGKIVAGYYRRDAGEILLAGQTVGLWTPHRALNSGVAMIHQEIQLVPGLSVADNVFLGQEERRGFFLPKGNRERYQQLESELAFGIRGDAIAGTLPLYRQQQVEIMRALARRADVIVMDEPTAILGPHEAERLHDIMRALRAKGRAIIYVTHFLDHVLSHCDRATIMRDGQVVETCVLSGRRRSDLVEAMLGRSVTQSYPDKRTPAPQAPTILHARGLTAGSAVRDVSLDVRKGEIVGLLGLVGSGRTEILRALAGVDRRDGGDVIFDGRALPSGDRHRARQSGLVLLPEDRRRQGIFPEESVCANMTLPYLSRFSRFGFVRRGAERAAVGKRIRQFAIVPSNMNLKIRGQSGGNQQKVLMARWLLDDPGLIMLDEPTRGVDIGSRQRIYDVIVDMAACGMAVLLVSSDFEEVLGLAHRAYLIREGRTIGEVAPDRVAADDITRMLFSGDNRTGRDLP